MKFISHLVVFASVLMVGTSNAHQDTPLKIVDGKIVGLPKKYNSSSFDFTKLSISIANKKLVFPQVLRDILLYDPDNNPFNNSPTLKPRPYTYKFSASWYHISDPKLVALGYELPPYILITITPPKTNFHYKLLINMDKLKFLRADVYINHNRPVPIDLDGIPDNPTKNKG